MQSPDPRHLVSRQSNGKATAGEAAASGGDCKAETRSLVAKSIGVVRVPFPELTVKSQIIQRVNLWTQEGDSFLTATIQKMEEFNTVERAETFCLTSCRHTKTKFVDPDIIKKRANETRILCMDEQMIEKAAVRCGPMSAMHGKSGMSSVNCKNIWTATGKPRK
jgi:hypothetical protein